MESLVLYGGAFDPIHNGHLRIARAASLLLNADVIFVPSGNPTWKAPCESGADRLAMVRAALRKDGSSAFSISTFELDRSDKPTYWVDTLRHFRSLYPKRKLYFLIGADEVNAFPTWKDPETCASIATPVYVNRPGVKLDDRVLSQYNMRRLAYDRLSPVTSSDVRSLRSNDIPSAVRKYIEDHRLYYIRTLGTMLTPHRLEHSISVANLCYDIARLNHLPEFQSAYIAGLIHDCGKHAPKEKALAYLRENFPGEYVSLPEWTFHQFMGRHIAEETWGITDEAVLGAVMYHATGKAHMSPLGKIVYSEDKIDPLRGYDSRKMIRACKKDYYVGFLTVLEANREYLTSKGYVTDNPFTECCIKEYLGGN